MAIQEVAPGFGTVGTDVEIIGDGFTNATGVQFGGVPAAMLVVNANLIRATVPPGAQTGKVTVLDPDGNQISPNDFIVRLPTAPENTARGQEALEQIFLICNAKMRGDSAALVRYSDRTVVFSDGSEVLLLDKPSTGSEPAMAEFEAAVNTYSPPTFELERMIINSDTVLLIGHETTNSGYKWHVQLKRTSSGYRVQHSNKFDV